MTLSEKVAEFSASIPDWQVAEALNTPNVAHPIRIDVLTSNVTDYLARIQKIRALKDLSNHANADVKELAESVRLVIEGRWQTIELSKPEIDAAFQAQLAAIVDLGILTQEQADELDAMGNSHQSWAMANIGTPVTARDVGLARGGK